MTEALTDAARNYWVDVNNGRHDLRQHVRLGANFASVIDATVNALVERGIDRSWVRGGHDVSAYSLRCSARYG